MRSSSLGIFLFSSLSAMTVTARADAVSDLLTQYQAAGAGPFTAKGGSELWGQSHPANHGTTRSRATCHTADLRAQGKHVVTGKAIDPLAPSVNPNRLTEGRQIEKWLTRNLDRNSAGRAPGAYSERTWRAARGRPPLLRITESDYFRGQHYEIPAKMVTGNPEVKSFSRCEVCHSRADRGVFNEHEVRRPGYGRFND
jgi:hypothetical protein